MVVADTMQLGTQARAFVFRNLFLATLVYVFKLFTKCRPNHLVPKIMNEYTLRLLLTVASLYMFVLYILALKPNRLSVLP